MNTDDLIVFLGWAALTYSWLSTNYRFFKAIAHAVDRHNEEIEGEDVGEDD